MLQNELDDLEFHLKSQIMYDWNNSHNIGKLIASTIK